MKLNVCNVILSLTVVTDHPAQCSTCYVNNIASESVDTIIDFGVKFDKDLRFTQHINLLKAQQRL